MPIIISADEIKKQIPHYSPDHAGDFHHESAQKADKLFAQALKISTYRKAILLSGGTAAGKTEFLSTQLNKKRCIILDATLATIAGAEIKIKKIIKSGRKPIIYSVIPDDLRRAFIAFLNRDRKFSDEHFYKTHSGSRETLLWIAQTFPMAELNIIESIYTSSGKLQFSQVRFDNKQKLLDYLIGKQMTENDIITHIGQIR